MSALIIDFYAAALRLRNKDLRKAAPGIQVEEYRLPDGSTRKDYIWGALADVEREKLVRALEDWRRGQPKPVLISTPMHKRSLYDMLTKSPDGKDATTWIEPRDILPADPLELFKPNWRNDK